MPPSFTIAAISPRSARRSGRTAAWTCLVLVALTGCAIEHRSDQFACTDDIDCEPGRTCASGFCVAAGSDIDAAVASGPDAFAGGMDANTDAAPDIDASPFVCPAACTSCVGETCVINCAGAGSCPDAIVCPAGIPCKVECGGVGACPLAIDCSGATGCRIECTNTDTCQGAIACGTGVCRVECGGDNSCAGGIDCQSSCLCDTFCDGAGACATAPTCRPPGQCTNGGDCTSGPGPCNSC